MIGTFALYADAIFQRKQRPIMIWIKTEKAKAGAQKNIGRELTTPFFISRINKEKEQRWLNVQILKVKK